MNNMLIVALSLALLSTSVCMAQPYYDGGTHPGWGQNLGSGHKWTRGEHMGYVDWNGALRVDFRQHHLLQPPDGYEWRASNGEYVLAATATGLIAATIPGDGAE